jgi:hypothetical protein
MWDIRGSSSGWADVELGAKVMDSGAGQGSTGTSLCGRVDRVDDMTAMPGIRWRTRRALGRVSIPLCHAARFLPLPASPKQHLVDHLVRNSQRTRLVYFVRRLLTRRSRALIEDFWTDGVLQQPALLQTANNSVQQCAIHSGYHDHSLQTDNMTKYILVCGGVIS